LMTFGWKFLLPVSLVTMLAYSAIKVLVIDA